MGPPGPNTPDVPPGTVQLGNTIFFFFSCKIRQSFKPEGVQTEIRSLAGEARTHFTTATRVRISFDRTSPGSRRGEHPSGQAGPHPRGPLINMGLHVRPEGSAPSRASARLPRLPRQPPPRAQGSRGSSPPLLLPKLGDQGGHAGISRASAVNSAEAPFDHASRPPSHHDRALVDDSAVLI